MLSCLPEIFARGEIPYPWSDPNPGSTRYSSIMHLTGDAVLTIVGSLCWGALVLGFVAEVAYTLLW
jgi:hypothetical protein